MDKITSRTFGDALTMLEAILRRIDKQRQATGDDRAGRRLAARLGVEAEVLACTIQELRGGADPEEDTADVPGAVVELAGYLRNYTSESLPVHPYAGSIPTRTTSGHCWVCVVVGHPVAHPGRDCGAVGCQVDHRQSTAAATSESMAVGVIGLAGDIGDPMAVPRVLVGAVSA